MIDAVLMTTPERRPEAVSLQRAAALFALAMALGGASPEPEPRGAGMLPPEIASQFSPGYLAGFGEPPLWRPEALRHYRSRVRLTINGILYTKISIRIDERANGWLEGHVAFVDPRDRESPDGLTERYFSVSRARFDTLQRAFQRANLWHLYPEFYPMTGDNICVDGMELIFERADANGYRFSTANAQCTAPGAMLQAAATMIDISGERRALAWLR
jgi:hypothetical protein